MYQKDAAPSWGEPERKANYISNATQICMHNYSSSWTTMAARAWAKLHSRTMNQQEKPALYQRSCQALI